ncbi:MAG: sugar ABC transporter permease [Protaetiibacter sp.]
MIAVRHGAHRRRAAVLGWAFLAPLAVLNLLVIVGPAAQSVIYSLTDWSGIGEAHFIGLGNYARMFTDGDLHAAFAHNAVWTAITLVVPTFLGLLGAFLLSRVRRFRLLFRVAYFIPFTVASVVSAAVWRTMLSPTEGFGAVLGLNFLGTKELALPSVALVNTWAFWGFLVVVYLSAMQAVNPALYEAAAIDGASPLRQFLSITIPSIRPTLVFMTMQSVIWSFLAFDFVYILTRGGPAGATEVLSTYMYRQAFSDLEAGYASAIGILLSLFSGIIVAIYQILRRMRGWEA